MADRDTPTLKTLESGAVHRDGQRPECRLSILLHPDPARIGESARLLELGADLPVGLSRATPGFGPDRRPLGHPRVSRSPLWLLPAPDGVRLSADGARARVAGQALAGDRLAPWETIDGHGLLIELGGCVLLWLHRALWPRPPRADLGLLGVTPAALALQEQVETLARTRLPLLIVGPTGSGKERVARAVHAGSPRADGPFLAVAAAELSPARAPELLHGQGAPGLLELADGGTLLLDEVSDLDDQVQPLLLRALDAGEARAVGGPLKRVDVRTLSTASAPLGDSDLRPALLHRLRGAELRIPPLSERRADIPVLFHHFLSRALAEDGRASRLSPTSEDRRPWLGSAVCAALTEHPLPGNARELRNLAVEVAARCADAPEASLPRSLAERLAPGREASDASAGLSPARVRAALAQEGWRVGPTAQALGVAKNTLLRFIRSTPGLHLASDLPAEQISRALDASGGDMDAAAAQLEVSPHGLKLRVRELGLS